MKRNMDCVRDLLLCVEENTGLRKKCYFIDYGLVEAQYLVGAEPILPAQYQLDLEKKYDNGELIYFRDYIIEAGWVKSCTLKNQYLTVIEDLTPAGHDFIDNIRTDKNWKKIKSFAENVGSFSAEVIAEISKAVVLDAAKQAVHMLR